MHKTSVLLLASLNPSGKAKRAGVNCNFVKSQTPIPHRKRANFPYSPNYNHEQTPLLPLFPNKETATQSFFKLFLKYTQKHYFPSHFHPQLFFFSKKSLYYATNPNYFINLSCPTHADNWSGWAPRHKRRFIGRFDFDYVGISQILRSVKSKATGTLLRGVYI